MLYAIVPVKRLIRAKTRLAPALSVGQRLRLAHEFLRRTLAICTEYPGRARTIVVSADPVVLLLARGKGMVALNEPGSGDINRGIEIGSRWARAQGATAVVVVPTDLPFLSARALRSFTQASPTPLIRLAADRHDKGTNALYLQPVGAGFVRFGENSLRRHGALAKTMGRPVEIVRAHALAFDVDVPTDWRLLTAQSRSGRDGFCKAAR